MDWFSAQSTQLLQAKQHRVDDGVGALHIAAPQHFEQLDQRDGVGFLQRCAGGSLQVVQLKILKNIKVNPMGCSLVF